MPTLTDLPDNDLKKKLLTMFHKVKVKTLRMNRKMGNLFKKIKDIKKRKNLKTEKYNNQNESSIGWVQQPHE